MASSMIAVFNSDIIKTLTIPHCDEVIRTSQIRATKFDFVEVPALLLHPHQNIVVANPGKYRFRIDGSLSGLFGASSDHSAQQIPSRCAPIWAF
ncbi:hypothetical protein DTO282F9_3646 [Paecilomyces variotii]|nr:hypothetical protein DTO282F9_3646 [Paecilomyces variotii]